MKRLALALSLALASAASAQQAAIPTDDIAAHPEWDAAYTRQIRQFTTGPQFITDLVDHLPASSTVPTPLKFLGYISGSENHLTYAEDVYRYMRALEAASPRVKVFTIGRSEEGREMIAVAISDEATIANLERFKNITRRLSDPRALSEADAQSLIDQGKPIYWATAAIHSPETGSPEMQMELAYRLAVDETPMFRNIRANVIALLTPVIEVDGRDRMVDLSRYRLQNPKLPTPPLVYWGHYVAHDNNRDYMGLGLALSRNVLSTYFDWHPQVFHDLHESVPFMYISTGTGPYNASLDPLMIDEWQRMAWHEVQTLTSKGLPGVWTYGFYDGWAPNYMFWTAMGHNSVGRFYETFGNRYPSTENRVVRSQSERTWFRANPPLPQVRWSLRNNINYQQSGLLLALTDMADNRRHFLQQFYELGKRSVAKATTEGPAAYVFDGSQKRQGQLRDLMKLLITHGIEVNVADQPFSTKAGWPPSAATPAGASDKPAAAPPAQTASTDSAASDDKKPAKAKDEPVKFPAGSLIVRLDQPYSRLADTLLDTQYVRSDERVYDDTGWTLGYQKNLEVRRIVNPEVLKVPMHRWTESHQPVKGSKLAITNAADTDLARLRFAAPQAKIVVLDEEVSASGRKWPAGTVIVSNDDGVALRRAFAGVNLSTTAIDSAVAAKSHELRTPRIALLHTWLRTQDEGWFRLALESLGVPYTYISTQDAAREADLRRRFDVILFPPSGGSGAQDIVNGLPPGPPLPWKKTELTPNLGVDQTDDMRPGLGLAGVDNLQRFVESGGLLITVGDTAEWAVSYGLARWVSVVKPEKVRAPGTILLASVTDRKSAVTAGYDETVPVYYNGAMLFRVGVLPRPDTRESRPSGRGGKDDPDVPQGRAYVPLPEQPKPSAGEEGFQPPEDAPYNFEPYMPRREDRPRVLVSLAKPADKLLLSGMLEGGDEIAGKPIVVDCPRGKGHVLLFAINPMWRLNTQGTYALVMNAIMNWDSL
jgi:Zinc carboxypeptidase